MRKDLCAMNVRNEVILLLTKTNFVILFDSWSLLITTVTYHNVIKIVTFSNLWAIGSYIWLVKPLSWNFGTWGSCWVKKLRTHISDSQVPFINITCLPKQEESYMQKIWLGLFIFYYIMNKFETNMMPRK